MQSELTKQLNAEKGVQNGGGSSNKTAASAAISEMAHQEGGTFKGSESAKMQSELDKAQNAQQVSNLDIACIFCRPTERDC